MSRAPIRSRSIWWYDCVWFRFCKWGCKWGWCWWWTCWWWTCWWWTCWAWWQSWGCWWCTCWWWNTQLLIIQLMASSTCMQSAITWVAKPCWHNVHCFKFIIPDGIWGLWQWRNCINFVIPDGTNHSTSCCRSRSRAAATRAATARAASRSRATATRCSWVWSDMWKAIWRIWTRTRSGKQCGRCGKWCWFHGGYHWS